MENKKERVFAYNLAKTIGNNDLASVSGGASTQMTHRETVRASGSSGSGVDVIYDQSVDW